MIDTQKSILAKLLATENIDVVHGNFKTAFFDVEKRTLGLPLWTQKEGVYDLLVGHEVGHALFTPPEGWHDATIEVPGCPRSYINVVEDIRIEKLIQRKYPGLVACFKRGYKKLNDDDFFGVTQIPALIPEYSHLIDRINLKAKLRDLVEVQFSDKESALVEEAFAVETWQDVLAVCKKLAEFAKKNPIKQATSMPNPNNETGDNDETTDSESTSHNSDSVDQNDNQNSDNESGSQNQKMESTDEPKGDSNNETESNENSKESDGVEASNGGSIESITDKAQRENEHTLIDQNESGSYSIVGNGFTNQQLNEMIFTYDDISASREEVELYSHQKAEIEEQFNTFMNENKKIVQIMAKEFEMRKAAWRSKRAQTARSGALDVNRLYAYKYTDDIFKRMTMMPDAKNHGMFMMIDYSGSMHNILQSVIKQTLVLAMFCRKVNIPYEVWGFTTHGNQYSYQYAKENKSNVPYSHVDHTNVKLIQVMSSTLSKQEQDKSIKELFKVGYAYGNRGYYNVSKLERLGGTPLDEMLIAAPVLVSKFARKFNIQKTNFVLLTDGFGGKIDIARHEKEEERGYWSTRSTATSLNVNGCLVKTSDDNDLTKALLKNMKYYCSSVTGYFLAANRSDFNQGMRRIHLDYNDFYETRKEFLKNKFVSFDDTQGYDRYFILRCDGKTLDTDTTEFEVRDNAKKGEIARAFKKHANSKKANRTLAVKFAEMVA
jgi:ACT domain-containing protein